MAKIERQMHSQWQGEVPCVYVSSGMNNSLLAPVDP